MKTSSRNISKLRVTLQNMYPAEPLKMAASSIVIVSITIISIISHGCLESLLLKIHSVISENKSSYNYQKNMRDNQNLSNVSYS